MAPKKPGEEQGLTKAEIRKTAKPLMEKKRRARINASLIELKNLLLDVLKKEGLRSNKMEKADILETTVKYLRQIQRTQITGSIAPENSGNRYQSGYMECMNEVSRYLNNVSGLDSGVLARLLNHIGNKVNNNNNSDSVSQPPVSHKLSIHHHSAPSTVPVTSSAVTAHVKPLQMSNQANSDNTASITTTSNSTSSKALSVANSVTTIAAKPAAAPQQYIIQAMPSKDGGIQVLNNFPVITSPISGGNVTFVIPAESLGGNGQLGGYMVPIQLGGALPAQPAVVSSEQTVVAPPTVTLPISSTTITTTTNIPTSDSPVFTPLNLSKQSSSPASCPASPATSPVPRLEPPPAPASAVVPPHCYTARASGASVKTETSQHNVHVPLMTSAVPALQSSMLQSADVCYKQETVKMPMESELRAKADVQRQGPAGNMWKPYL